MTADSPRFTFSNVRKRVLESNRDPIPGLVDPPATQVVHSLTAHCVCGVATHSVVGPGEAVTSVFGGYNVSCSGCNLSDTVREIE